MSQVKVHWSSGIGTVNSRRGCLSPSCGRWTLILSFNRLWLVLMRQVSATGWGGRREDCPLTGSNKPLIRRWWHWYYSYITTILQIYHIDIPAISQWLQLSLLKSGRWYAMPVKLTVTSTHSGRDDMSTSVNPKSFTSCFTVISNFSPRLYFCQRADRSHCHRGWVSLWCSLVQEV